MRYILAILVGLSLCLSPAGILSAAAETKTNTVGLETTAASAVLMDAGTGAVLWSKEPDKELPMASVTKVMTQLIANEALAKGQIRLQDQVTVSDNAAKMGGSQVFLEPGEAMSMKEMLISIAVGSANDASVAVAEHIAGSEEAFVKLMNKRAEELGLKHTRFANCNGLPSKEPHYTSAYDMAVILREALKYPAFREYSSIYRYDLRGGDFVLWNTNKLLKWYRGVDAGKTGWTEEAKYCLASSAERDGLRLITVVLGTPETRSHFRESIKIYNYGFSHYEAVTFAPQELKTATVKIDKGVMDQVGVIASSNIAMAVPKGKKDEYSGRTVLPDNVEAPVKKGQQLGEFVVTRGDKEVLQVPLLAQQDVKSASVLQEIHKVLDRALTG
ncbi:MAG: D-alanyl-D-alanine carboxypeptidase [Firmicutes bacterium]|nr:D-alanyl-D-alanine carboxypeptidase [Bacillota bacterium]